MEALIKFRLDGRGLTMLEILIVLSLLVIIAAGMRASWLPFKGSQDLDFAAVTLIADLAQAKQFSRGGKEKSGTSTNYSYYGLRFYGGLGSNANRNGWKIIRFCDTDGSGKCETELTASDIPLSSPEGSCLTPSAISCEFVKSPVSSDDPEIIDDTFFARGIDFAAGSDFSNGDTIIFTSSGTATSDGETLLTDTSGDGKIAVVLTNGRITKTIKIEPLTGYARIP